MEPLEVDALFFYPMENAKVHNTFKYEVVNEENAQTTVVRRGQPFNGVIRFTRPFDEENDVVQLVFNIGDKPSIVTQGSMFLRKNVVIRKNSWTGKLTHVQNDTVHIQVSTPVTTPVGCWSVRVITRLKNANERKIYDYDQDVYVLFNPWMIDDQTYMEDAQLLQEYVLNDVGKIWMGPLKSTKGKAWEFGQFDATILPACMLLLDRAEMPFHDRGDPVKMSRVISAAVNAQDEGGVIVGRWDSDYADGTAPSQWTGSVEILQQFLETQEPVSYGQCWVFSGVVTTVCRALGLPCRPVTNVVSGHDANNTLSIDKYYTETMEEVPGDPTNPEGADSIWTYHVWNDVWMARPDLPAGFGGWQAIDATPQEVSQGMYQCGPAPVEAIKQGVTGLSYDVEFMLSSVNADLMRWRMDPDSETGFSIVDTNTYHIGRMILTKKPYIFDPNGEADREDITSLYKHVEGTFSERPALMNGVRHSDRAKRYYEMANNMKKEDVTFKLQDIDSIFIGKEFRIVVNIENTSNEPRRVKAALTATSIFYNGVKADVVKRREGQILVAPNKSEQVSILVTPQEYMPKLVEYCNLKINAMAIVDETKQSWADDDDFQVVKPDIVVKINQDLLLNQQGSVSLVFTNPLEYALTECEYRLTSPGIAGRTIKLAATNVGPRQTSSVEVPVVPNKPGTINFIATFNSKELKDIRGAASVEIFEE